MDCVDCVGYVNPSAAVLTKYHRANRRTRDEAAEAYHEAGHALIALKSGIGVRYATLRPRDPDCLGQVVYTNHAHQGLGRSRPAVL